MIYGVIESVLAIMLIVRYVIDNNSYEKNARSRVSQCNETFGNYSAGIIIGNVIFIILYALVILGSWADIQAGKTDTIEGAHIVGIIYLICLVVKLPFSKGSYIKWLDKAPEREKERAKAVVKADIRNWLNQTGEEEFVNNEIKRLGMSATKTIATSDNGYFVIDDNNKQFSHISTNKIEFEDERLEFLGEEHIERATEALRDKHFEEVLNKHTVDELQEWNTEAIKNQLLIDYYGTSNLITAFKFSDLIRVQVVDKTQVDTERSFTMESNAGKAIAGAFLGEFLLGGVMSAPVGAIAGAVGGRKISENVKTTTYVAFDVVMYLNSLENNVYTIRLNNENQLRELVGALEYILNNK